METALSATAELAEGCVCTRCDQSCSMAMFRSCCGACMASSPFEELNTESPQQCWARITAATAPEWECTRCGTDCNRHRPRA